MTRHSAHPVVALRHIELAYGGLRPLRIERLSIASRDRVAIIGVDAPMAEGIVTLVTGAVLPQRGDVVVRGHRTADVAGADEWLGSLDWLGLVSARAVLLEELSVFQNLAMTFTLSIDDVPADAAAAVQNLADEVGLARDRLQAPVGRLAAIDVARCHLARALAANPVLIVCEHANALAGEDGPAFGRVVAGVADARRIAVLALTADERFARAVARRVLALDAASGALIDRGGWRRWVRIGLP